MSFVFQLYVNGITLYTFSCLLSASVKFVTALILLQVVIDVYFVGMDFHCMTLPQFIYLFYC